MTSPSPDAASAVPRALAVVRKVTVSTYLPLLRPNRVHSSPPIASLPAPYRVRIAVHVVPVGDVASPSCTHDSHLGDPSSNSSKGRHLRSVALPHYICVAPTTNDRASRGLHDVEQIDKPVSCYWWQPDKLFAASSPLSHRLTVAERQMTL